MSPQDIISKYQLESEVKYIKDRITDLSLIDHCLNLVLSTHKYHKGQNCGLYFYCGLIMLYGTINLLRNY